MNRLPIEKRIQIVTLMVEGMSLRVTPAMQAGIADHVWTIEEIVRLAAEPAAKERGPYKKRDIA